MTSKQVSLSSNHFNDSNNASQTPHHHAQQFSTGSLSFDAVGSTLEMATDPEDPRQQ
jgi:hypothetical protein